MKKVIDKNVPKYYSKSKSYITDVPGQIQKYTIFNRWGVRYRLKRLAKNSYGKTLDIGYAYGVNPFLKDAYGLDVFIPEKKPSNYIHFSKVDIDNPYPYPYKNKFFDSVIAGEVVEHLADMDSFMKEMNRILKKGGLLCLSTPNPESPVEVIVQGWHWVKGYDFNAGMKGGHIHEFPATNMITLMKNYGFRMIKIEGTYIQIPFTNIQIVMNIVPLTYCTIYIAKKVKDI